MPAAREPNHFRATQLHAQSKRHSAMRTSCLLLPLLVGGCRDSSSRAIQQLSSTSDSAREATTGLSTPSDVARDGNLWYVADAAEDAAIVLDDEGLERKRIGSRGAGPGELRTPSAISVRGARVLVADLGNRRVSEFDTSGAFVRVISSTGCIGSAVALRILDRGALLLRRCRQSDDADSLVLEIEEAGEFRPSRIAYALSSTPGALPTIAFPLFDANESRVVIGNGQTGCVTEYDLDGRERPLPLCFEALVALAVPDSVRERMMGRVRGRLEVPRVLPKLLAITLQDSSIAVLVPVDHVRSMWLRMRSLQNGKHSSGHPISAPFERRSFMSPTRVLSFRDSDQGLRAASIPVDR